MKPWKGDEYSVSEEAVKKGRHVCCAASNGYRSDVSTIFVNNRQDVDFLLSLYLLLYFLPWLVVGQNTTTHKIVLWKMCENAALRRETATQTKYDRKGQ